MDMIQTDKLVFEYDKRDEDGNIIGKSRAIDEVDIDVKEGQFIAILGHNGSGKSTFAKHINALLVPTDGTMWVDGRDTKDPNELWNVRPNKLSGGQKQRVAIAGVIAMEPKCIVLDEPTAMLDPMGRKEVLKTVQKLREQKKVTVILITHYMEEVVDADKIYVMDHGHVVMEGTPKEIFSQVDTLKHYRLDVPQVTILADELKKRGLDIPDGILTKEELVEALCQLK